MQRIHLASDHAGFDLKATLAQHLTGLGYEVIDDGAYSKDSCDYPVFAHKLCEAVERENCPGILICGTGIGMSLAANRHPGIRARALHHRAARPLRPPPQQRQCARLGARVTGVELALAIVGTFLENQFEGGRHQRRLDLLKVPA